MEAESAATREGVRGALERARAGVRQAEWGLLWMLHEVCNSDPPLWREWGFTSRASWSREDCQELSQGAMSRMVKLGGWLASQPEEVAVMYEQHSVWKATELLEIAEVDADRAGTLLSENATIRKIREEVRENRPELHREAAGVWVRIQLPADLYDKYSEVLNLFRFLMGKRAPTDSEVWEMWMADTLEGLVPTMQERMSRRPDGDEWLEKIRRGEFRCRECGAWADLQQHHVIPRSKGARGYAGPLVTLCVNCHQQVTEHWGGNYRDYAKKWGFGPEVYEADDAPFLERDPGGQG